MLKADLEVVREIISGKAKFVKQSDFDAYVEDRLLFAIDSIDTIRESLNNISNLHLTNLSHRMNESMHKLTVIGSLLLIPTVIASLFGMNVALPPLDFWTIIAISVILSMIMAAILKKIGWI